MKNLILTVSAVLLAFAGTACAPYLFDSIETEEVYRRNISSSPADHKISTLEYTYEIKSADKLQSASPDRLVLRMKRGGLLSAEYSGKNIKPFTLIYNNGNVFRYLPAEKTVEEIQDDLRMTAGLRFFYDANFHGFTFVAEHISLRSPRTISHNGISCYVFDVEPKPEYLLDRVAVFMDASRRIFVGLQYETDDEVPVACDYPKVEIVNGIAVPKVIKGSVLNDSFTLTLKQFRMNIEMDDSLFNPAVQSAPAADAAAGTPSKTK